MKNTIIYGLVDPITNQLRYVGKTVQNPKYRYSSHISVSKHNHKKDYTHCWIKSLLNKNLKPELIIIEENTILEDEIFYIEYYKTIGCNLTNHSKGGDKGTLGHTWKISADKLWKYKFKGNKPVLQYDSDGNFIKEWVSGREFSRHYNLNKGAVSVALHYNCKCKGFILKKKESK